jgi:aryl-phospho-beta-D-glucosidase BglC (GH1 family)
VDAWSVGEWWPPDYLYLPFATRGDDGPVAVERVTGALLIEQAELSDEPRGVNVSGGEFGSVGGEDTVSDFSNENPGTYGEDYQYASRATYDFLASHGMDTVRLPFRWERIQPELGAPLDPAELERLRSTVWQATTAGLQVILDVQNFGAYHLDDGGIGVRRAIGSEQVSRSDFADLWSRLSAEFADTPGVVAYDLMNEPVNMPSVDGMTGAQLWEAASQDAVTAIRDRGDDKLILVPGYNWSHPGGWAQQHPKAWIDDPAGNIRYAAHHYWLAGYEHSYDSEVERAAASGY